MEAKRVVEFVSILVNVAAIGFWLLQRPKKCPACGTRLAVKNGYCQACGEAPSGHKRSMGVVETPSTRDAQLIAFLIYLAAVVMTLVALSTGILPSSGSTFLIGLGVIVGGLVVAILYAKRKSTCVVCGTQSFGRFCSQCGALTGND